MLFYSLFEQCINKEITIELKNDIEIKGILIDLDVFLNLKLIIKKYNGPEELKNINNAFIRGSHIKFIHFNLNNQLEEKITEASRYRFVLMKKYEERNYIEN